MRDKNSILSGFRPAGRLHLGHYLGVLQQAVSLQKSHGSFIMLADLDVLISGAVNSSDLAACRSDMVLDLLSVGVDPACSTLFVQSQVRQHAELQLLLSRFAPVRELDNRRSGGGRRAADKATPTLGSLSGSVSWAADILLYRVGSALVGANQLPLMESSLEIARKFVESLGDTFAEPEVRRSAVSELPGLDRQRMSTSGQNCIYLSESRSKVAAKVSKMRTDPARLRRNDPGNPQVCGVFAYHQIVNEGEVPEIESACRKATLGCVDCKKNLAEKINAVIDPFRARRAQLERDPKYVRAAVEQGNQRARVVAELTMEPLREKLNLQ